MAPDSIPVYGNVAFARIAAFDRRSVAEQAALKERLEAHIRSALARVADAERAVLDADDGVAVVLFVPPARALDLAQALQRAPEALPVQLGLNHGPLGLTAAGNDGRVFGDGLTAAAAAARFAAPHQLLVTQDFANALEAQDPARATSLEPAGDFTDTRVRQHSLYRPDPSREARRRRHVLMLGVAGTVAILALGAAARMASHWLFPPRPAVVTLAIKPRGEILLDGVLQGQAPPLTQITVPAGRHVLTVRHSGYAPLELALDLQAGEQMRVAHSFTAPRPTEPRRGFWQDLRRKLGRP